MINVEKSSILFSKNTSEEVRFQVLNALGGMKKVKNSQYLGLPMVIGRSKNAIFQYINERIRKKLNSWKERLLSPAGKEVLIKLVAMAMPAYAMNCCKLPKGLCREISSALAKFWWGESKNGKKIHWVSWEKLSEVKGRGGLGFRDMECFNDAMLAKQLWRVVSQPNLLVSKILRSKYFKGKSLWVMETRPADSWMWRSLLSFN